MKLLLSIPLTLKFIAIILLAIQNLFVQANSNIEKACKTYYKNPTNDGTQTCVTILRALPNYEHDDPRAVALQGMEFAEFKVSEIAETIKNKLKDRSVSPRVYGALRRCMELYNEGSYSFGYGVLAFKEENYESVHYRWLNGVYYDVVQCEHELNKVGVKGVDLGINKEFMLNVFDSTQAVFHHFSNTHIYVNNTSNS